MRKKERQRKRERKRDRERSYPWMPAARGGGERESSNDCVPLLATKERGGFQPKPTGLRRATCDCRITVRHLNDDHTSPVQKKRREIASAASKGSSSGDASEKSSNGAEIRTIIHVGNLRRSSFVWLALFLIITYCCSVIYNYQFQSMPVPLSAE